MTAPRENDAVLDAAEQLIEERELGHRGPRPYERAARSTLHTLCAAFLGVIVLLLVVVLLRGPVAPPAMTVNDDAGCRAPTTALNPQQLATVQWWESC